MKVVANALHKKVEQYLFEAAGSEGQRSQMEKSVAPSGKVRLLIVDDSAFMRDAIKTWQPPPSKGAPTPALSCPNPCQVLAIAASTGGPAALAHILARLPAHFPVPVLIAQHIAAGFAPGMVAWLNGLSPLKVKLGSAGETIVAGTVYVTPSECHMSVDADCRLDFSESVPADIHHPCCDRLLVSVAQVYGKEAVGVILTGMGNDGAAGMQKIFAAGGFTVAEDKSTSIIFGMNQVAINAGSIREVLPLQDIPAAICRLAGTKPC